MSTDVAKIGREQIESFVEHLVATKAPATANNRYRHWRIAGVPDVVMEVHSKQAAAISAECQRRGGSYLAQSVAARSTCRSKQAEGVKAQLVERWAVRDLAQSSAAREQHARRWRDRRTAIRQETVWAEREADAQRRHEVHAVPELARLDQHTETCRTTLEGIEVQLERYQHSQRAGADLCDTAARNVSRLSAHLTTYRNDIDGIPQPPALRPARALHAQQARLHPPAAEPPTPRRPELGIGI